MDKKKYTNAEHNKLMIERKRAALEDRHLCIHKSKIDWDKRKEEQKTIQRKREAIANEFIRKYLIHGNSTDYFMFLDTYIKSGGKVSHHYDYEFRGNRVYIARNICEIFPLYGSSAIMVIMMPGCRVTEGDKGHNNFYSYDDILNQKYASWFPTYSDWK